MDATSAMVEVLRQRKYLTPLERDIIITQDQLHQYPFDMDAAKQRVFSNDINYPEIAAAANALPTTIFKQREQITENDFRYMERKDKDENLTPALVYYNTFSIEMINPNTLPTWIM